MTDVRLLTTTDLTAADIERLFDRRVADDAAVAETCAGVIADVRARGDAAVRDLTRAYDGVDLTNRPLAVSLEEFDAADAMLDARLRAAIDTTLVNARRFHAAQVPQRDQWVEVAPGVRCGERWLPIDAVCLYVPRGRGSFASVACMLGTPAVIAGVQRVIVCTPPGPDGQVDAATLVACRQLGITEVYRVGGAQAVAAVACGTDEIPRCDKFLGPGNVYVSTARRLLRDDIDTGLIAGPSESLIICDDTADPDNAAWNLLIEAEHGENSTAWLMTDSAALGQAVAERVTAALPSLGEQRRAYASTVLSTRGGILVARDEAELLELSNRFAAEHVAVMSQRPERLVNGLRHAGEVLSGAFPIISLANYVMGLNAILPTGGWARTSGGVGVRDFMKRIQLGEVSATGFARLREAVSIWSRDEGFSAHHLAVENWTAPRTEEVSA